MCLYTFLKFASRLFLNGLKSLFFDLEVGDWFKSRNLSETSEFRDFARLQDFGDNYGEFQEIFARK